MDVVCILVAADRYHVGVEAFSDTKPVLAERVALPLGKGVDDFRHLAGFLDVEGYGALHAV